MSNKSRLTARVPSTRALFGRSSWPSATEGGALLARDYTDFNSAGSHDCGPRHATTSADTGQLNPNMMARTWRGRVRQASHPRPWY